MDQKHTVDFDDVALVVRLNLHDAARGKRRIDAPGFLLHLINLARVPVHIGDMDHQPNRKP
jgi:hypothetical protein